MEQDFLNEMNSAANNGKRIVSLQIYSPFKQDKYRHPDYYVLRNKYAFLEKKISKPFFVK